MKKLITVLALILTLALCLPMFAACDNLFGTEKPDDSTSPTKDTVKVYWYEGTKELRVDEVEKGTKIESWTPTSESGEFDGWYAEASRETPFDFSKEITEDTDIFAKFKSNEFVADPNEYYLVGTGAGDMKDSNWDPTNAKNILNMTRETVDGANVYTITLLLYAGDQFQICYGGSWNGQQGIGFVEGVKYVDGTHPTKGEATAEDKLVARVDDAEGEPIFWGFEENGKTYEPWNIKLADGRDGIYKITLTTYPGQTSYNRITWELVEAKEPMTVTHDMHFIGTMNEWSESYEDGELALTPTDDKSAWTGFITITEDMYANWTADESGNLYAALKIYNVIDDQYYSDTGENILLSAGTYAFKYTVENNKVEYQKLDYYVVGTFVDGEGNTVNFSIKEGVTPVLVDGSVVVTATDVTAKYDWISDQGKPGVFAIKVVYGCELAIKDWYAADGGDNFYLYAGQHTVTFADGVVTVTPVAAE